MLDAQYVDRKLQYRQAVEIRMDDHIGDIAMHEQFARLHADNLVGRDATVGTAYPQEFRVLLGNQLLEKIRIGRDHLGRPLLIIGDQLAQCPVKFAHAKFKIVSYASHAQNPTWFTTAPVEAMKKALDKAKLKLEQIDLFEINEAFAIQVLSFLDHFGIADDDKRVNIYGGAIAVGHPLASSGVRLILNLANGFKDHPEVRYGITTMCIGLGMGGTIIWENPNFKGAK